MCWGFHRWLDSSGRLVLVQLPSDSLLLLVPRAGIEGPRAEQERKVEEGRATVPKREERRGLAKSLMRTSRSCAVVWYGYSVSSPGEVTMCRPGLDEVGRQVVVAWGM